MPKPTSKSRQDLRTRFVRNAIPTEADFADLIGASLNQADDGLLKLPDDTLGVVRKKPDQPVLRFYADPGAEGSVWQVKLSDGDKPGFVLAGQDGKAAVFVDEATGNFGVGTTTPSHRIDVNGTARFGGFSDEDKDEGPNIVWQKSTERGRKEGLIKHGSGRGFFQREGFGLHIQTNKDFTLFSTEWEPLLGVEGDTGNASIRGQTNILTGSNPLRFSSAWTAFPDDKTNGAEICNDTTIFKTLMIVGNKSAGGSRRVDVWDQLHVHGQLSAHGTAIQESTNGCQLEVFAPDANDCSLYTKIRFHQHRQYWAWLGYHGLSPNNMGEFVFWNINQNKEARARFGDVIAKGSVVRAIWAITGNGPNDEQDNGRVASRTLRINKLFPDTALRVLYCDNFRVAGDNVACRWEIRVDGNSVSPPILADRYEPTGNRHLHGTVMGYARGIAAGAHEIQIWVLPHPHNANTPTNVYTGWSASTWSLEAEEIWLP